jgi:hypothetical protein
MMPHVHLSHRYAATRTNGSWRAASAIPFDEEAALEP